MTPSLPASRGFVALIALGLIALTCSALMLTNDMGFTRDESFYFRYGRQYAEWFQALEDAKTVKEAQHVMSRREVVDTWIGNFEHPPLMKSAFGAAWRHLAYKDRRVIVSNKASEGAGVRLRVTGLAPSDGFPVGATVSVLSPLEVGGLPTEPTRELAEGRVVERRGRDAMVQVDGAEASAFELCTGQADVPMMTGCQARERRFLAVFDEATAMRVPGVLATVLAVLFTFLLGVSTVGWFPGLFAALAFLFCPRHFFHGHLIAFDMGIVAAMMATLYCFWRARTDRRWAVLTGVAWGCALLIKHNAFFMPVPLLLFWLWAGRKEASLSLRGLRVTLPPLPLTLLVMPVIALPMLFIFWPKLWFDPYRAVADYFQFHLQHDHYMQWYFGQPLEVPPFPWAFPFVMTAWTLPEVFLVLIVVGIVLWGRLALRGGDSRHTLAFLLFNGLAPILLIALPSTPIFGGIKHWMTGMPLLLLCAGFAVQWLCQRTVFRLPWRTLRPVGAAALVVLLFVAPVRASLESSPFGTAYYNALVAGGARGAADAQLTRLYWGHTSRQALEWLNVNAPINAPVFFQNTTRDAYDMYRRVGLIRHDIRFTQDEERAAIALIEPQKAFEELDRRVREAFGVAGPSWVVRYQGVPMLRVYVRESRQPAATSPEARRTGSPGS
ncbi:MAG: glycosyltransferase family 39 protein [Myxococcota bacterium]